jgi:hypothetical protein
MTTAVRLRGLAGAPPWGTVFLGAGVLGVAAVGLLHLDHLPFSTCFFKLLTGLPCPTCGTTRALGRLFALDVAGAFAMNPLATLGAIALLAWGLTDLALLPARKALAIEVSDPVARVLRVAALVAVVLNWVFLIASGR